MDGIQLLERRSALRPSQVCLSGGHSQIELHSPPQWAHVTINRSFLGSELHFEDSQTDDVPEGLESNPCSVSEGPSGPHQNTDPSDRAQSLCFCCVCVRVAASTCSVWTIYTALNPLQGPEEKGPSSKSESGVYFTIRLFSRDTMLLLSASSLFGAPKDLWSLP